MVTHSAATSVVQKSAGRLSHFDWMRGLACVLMFQTHCYDSWLAPAARSSRFFMYSQLLGTLPAPLFLFLTGISSVLIMRKLSPAGEVSREAAVRMIRRGGFVWGLGMLFRVQEYLIAFPWAPWTDLLRVDVLNCIGLSLALVGVLAFVTRGAGRMALCSGLVAAAVSMLTPLVWVHRPAWLPWFLESYLNGVHTAGKPLPWLFPLFPWAAFTFAGVTAGFLLLSGAAKQNPRAAIPLAACAGLAVSGLGYALDHLPFQLYPVYDFWHTSPNFFLIRLGILLMIVAASQARFLLPSILGKGRFLVLLGQHSLLVYWVHIEFVYGRFHILPRRGVGILGASAGLLAITLAMLALAFLRSKWEIRRKSPLKAAMSPA